MPDADHLSSRDLRRLADFVYDYCGIKLPSTKQVMVEGRLRRRLRATGKANLSEYCRYLFEEDGMESEAIHLIDAITTNKTDFFREPEHFRFLVEEALPQMISDRRGTPGPLKFWSAASSIGAEPYTLAMVLADYGLRERSLKTQIFATDISTKVLAQVTEAIYPHAMIEPVPIEMRKRYLLRSKTQPKEVVRIAPELRAMIRTGRLNLMDERYSIDKDMDAIFCRNVLIYFDKPTQSAVLRRLCDHLRPGGYLFLGHSESLSGQGLPVASLGSSIFRRV
ncbi:CheR family methyltransferase [Lacibacterium aquatile]|uniref:Chemotaxis protein methyltransferase n=1 Tax=Lacibacterium aquatile TaxID=1168082 RepID=A0ABW5DPB9_9PROT